MTDELRLGILDLRFRNYESRVVTSDFLMTFFAKIPKNKAKRIPMIAPTIISPGNAFRDILYYRQR